MSARYSAWACRTHSHFGKVTHEHGLSPNSNLLRKSLGQKTAKSPLR
jgi:hypothetical protein